MFCLFGRLLPPKKWNDNNDNNDNYNKHIGGSPPPLIGVILYIYIFIYIYNIKSSLFSLLHYCNCHYCHYCHVMIKKDDVYDFFP